jgi:hypothetical protein
MDLVMAHKISAEVRRDARGHLDTDEWRDHMREYQRGARASRKHDEIAYVAFSPAFGYIKIGHSAEFKSRWSTLRSGCPDLQLACIVTGGREAEHALQDVLESQHIEREWFRVPHGMTVETVRPYIRNLLANFPEFIVHFVSENYFQFALTGALEAA